MQQFIIFKALDIHDLIQDSLNKKVLFLGSFFTHEEADTKWLTCPSSQS